MGAGAPQPPENPPRFTVKLYLKGDNPVTGKVGPLDLMVNGKPVRQIDPVRLDTSPHSLHLFELSDVPVIGNLRIAIRTGGRARAGLAALEFIRQPD